MIEINHKLSYKITIYFKQISVPSNTNGRFMVGVVFQGKHRNWCSVSRRFANYKVDRKCEAVGNMWEHLTFTIGNSSDKLKFLEHIKYMGICIIINLNGGNAIYQISGAQIEQI